MLSALYFDVLSYTAENRALLSQSFNVISIPDPSHASERILANIHVVFAPLGFRFDEGFFSRTPQLKVIATNTTGIAHIDAEAASRREIIVISLRDDTDFLSEITPTAEFTIGLIIALTRNLVPALDAVHSGAWRRWDFGGKAMLSRMSLGIVGLGRLGQMVATVATSMRMKVGYYDPYLENLSHEAKTYQSFACIEDLVHDSDITSLHIPMEANNLRIFDARMFRLFKEGSYFINTARGELVDSEALVSVLRSGRLAGAAVDVLDGEFDQNFPTAISNHPLVCYAREHSNLLITPHIGGSTMDAWSSTQRRTIEKAASAAYGSPNKS